MWREVAEEQGYLSEGLTLCKKIVFSLRKRLCLDQSLHEELLNSAYLGLAEAIKRYDNTKGDFLNFAAIRIRGACLDYLRTCTHLGPKAYKLSKALTLYTEYQKLSDSGSLKAEDLLCIGALTWQVTTTQQEVENKPDTKELDQEGTLMREELINALKKHVERMPKAYRELYESCYENDMNFAEYARQKKVSKTSVCKMHKRILNYLRSKLYEEGYFN